MDENSKNLKNKPKKQKDTSSAKWFAELLVIIAVAIVIAVFINTFVLTATRVHGISMDDTLYGGSDNVDEKTFFNTFFFGRNDKNIYGDKVILFRTKKVKKGDIVVFKACDSHNNPVYAKDNKGNVVQEQWIKRVIGTAGDEIEIKGGYVYVNGEKIDEPYVKQQGVTYYDNYNHDYNFKTKVGDGEIFCMGDNRLNSSDSRRVGCIKTKNLVGKVILVIGKKSQSIKTPKKISNLIFAPVTSSLIENLI